MTATFEHAIRYRDHGSNEDTLLAVDNTQQQADAIRAMLLHHGVVAEPVTVTYTVDKTVRDATARDIVTETGELVLQGEITLDAGLERIRLFSPALLSEDQVFARYDQGHDVDPHCTREYWLEDLTSATARCDALAAGDLGSADYDGDAEDERRNRAVDVLAGVAQHTNDGRACGLCADVAATRTDVAA